MIKRRDFIKTAAAGGLLMSPAMQVMAASGRQPFRIGACDWSIDCRGELKAFDVAKEIGLDGVQVSFGGGDEKNNLRLPDVRKTYLEKAADTRVAITSLAMGVLNQTPYASDPRTEKWVEECIDAMAAMKVEIVLLAFFGDGDIKDKPELQDEVIKRLKRVAPKAEKAGVILGLETWLNAEEHIRIVDSVASPAVKVYYDVANMTTRGYDLEKEIRQLGHDRICQVHCKENDLLLGKGKVDFTKVRNSLADINYSNWLVIEGATENKKPVVDCYRHNLDYLNGVFNPQ